MQENPETTRKKNIAPYLLFSGLFFAGALLLLFFTDPYKSPLFVLVFYLVLIGFCLNFFMALLLGIFYKKQLLAKPELHNTALRQAILLTVLAAGLLFLSAQSLLFWWVGVIFIAAIVSFEGFFLFS